MKGLALVFWAGSRGDFTSPRTPLWDIFGQKISKGVGV